MNSKAEQNYFFVLLSVAAVGLTGPASAAEPATLADFMAGITPGTAAFFAALFSMLLLLMIVSLSVGERLWAALAALIAMYGLWFWAAEQRSQDLFLVNHVYDTHILAFASHFIHAGLYFLGARTIPKHHRLSWMKPIFTATAGITICVGLLGWFVEVETAIDLSNVSGLWLGASTIIPFLAAERLASETLRPIFVYAIIFFLPIGTVYLWLLFFSELNITLLLDFNRVVYAWIVAFGGFMTIRRIIALREDRAQVLQQALTAAQKESETNRALFEAERKYADARMAVLRQSNLLADVSHDIKQPIASLRTNVDVLTTDQPEALRAQLRSAFDYLESLASTYKDDGFRDETAPPMAGPETVPLDVVFKTLDTMFREEAEAKRLDFLVDSTNLSVSGDALIIMRILSNLVSNAIKHTASGHVQICARRGTEGVRIEVANSGETLSSDQLDKILERGSKDNSSRGEGLGLAICKSLAETNGIDFTYGSEPERGNVFSLGFVAQATSTQPS